MAAELAVDPVACDAFGYCAELLPGLVRLDEWGYPLLASGTVPPELAALARRAVEACPRRALLLAERPPAQPGGDLSRRATSRA